MTRPPGRLAALALACLLVSPLTVAAQPDAQGNEYRPQRVFLAMPDSVLDGLTFTVPPHGVCRLAGLDGPVAPQQEAGEAPARVRARAALAESSRAALERLLGASEILVVDYGPDRRGRMLCVVLTGAGENAGLEMVRAGMAEAYILPGTPFAAALLEAEERAWEAKRGLWGFPGYRKAREERKRLRGGPSLSEPVAPSYWDTMPGGTPPIAPPCLDPSCR